ncbi:MAG: diacylglycerol/lipid kinase family protein [Acidimicrobiia bacterium]
MRIRLIVNEHASSVTPTRRMIVEKALDADHELEVVTTRERGHATDLAADAATTGVDVVVVLAGDGTLNEAANGLLGTHTALTPLPGGSTSVFARILGYSTDTIEALGQLLYALEARRIIPVGIGSINGRAFLCHAGIGFDAAVIERIERRAALKRVVGHPAFVGTAFDTWFRRFDRARTRFSLEIAGETIDDVGLAIVENTDPYTFLGNRPVRLEPRAKLDTPFGVLALRRIRLTQVLRTSVGALSTDRLFEHHHDVLRRFPVSSVTVRAKTPVPYQIDGEYLGVSNALDVQYHADALRVVRP